MVGGAGQLDLSPGAGIVVLLPVFFQAKGYPFTNDMSPDPTPADTEWVPLLILFAHNYFLCVQETWSILKSLVEPISFKPVGRFRTLFD